MQGVNPLLSTGASRPLEMGDVSSVEDRERVALVYDSFRELWADELRLEKGERSLFRALRRTLDGREQIWALFISMVAAGGACGPPLILKALSEHFSGTDVLSQSTLWILVSLLFVIPFVCSLCSAHSFVIFAHTACILRSALLPAVYNKSMELGSQSKSQFGIGQINNLFSNDINYIQSFVQQFAADIFSPGQLALALGLIYVEVGVSMFAGLVLVAALLPILLICFGGYARSRIRKSKVADFRMKLTNEVLSGIRILKYYAWEIPFFEKIDRIRESELSILAIMNTLMVIIVLFITAIPYVMPIIIFLFFAAINGGVLDITVAFTTLSLLGLITGPIMTIPALFQRYFQAVISLRRLQDFLQASALERYVTRLGVEDIDTNGEDQCDAIVFKHASLSWRSDENAKADATNQDMASTGDVEMVAKPSAADYQAVNLTNVEDAKISDPVNRSSHTLIDINVCIKRGELVGVVGSVGSGKSSFLSAMLNELLLQSGSVAVMEGTIAYHAQQAWILNANVRDNILLGAPMDRDRFEAAIDAASLRPDIAIFPAGLDTEIGEKGINLSGGQKARVSFARAVYRNADIYFLGIFCIIN
jgi:ABC-type multidrug transport system fused ATPase/permease subunit